MLPSGIQTKRQKLFQWGSAMRRMLLRMVFGIVATSSIISAGAAGQVTPSQGVVTDSSVVTPEPPSSAPSAPSAPSTPSIEILRPVPTSEATDVVIDPASLLPDLPKLPEAKASLIGGTVGRLDRVRDQITVQIFGGGKMKIFFDPRTHIYHDGAEASLSDLHQGDRVYVETILDGSNVFARAIRLKTSTSAGESQGIITSYSESKGELQVRDALSPQTIKIRVTPQTRIIEGNHAASATKLSPGTLVAVKFGARKDGGEVASEVSVLASPGDSFTFAGQVTAIDLRLGLMVLTSSTDHKTYEIYLDPSVMTIDESVRPSVDVTVLTRFQGNRYVARSITVNSLIQR
jgi:hypothetical protein